VVYKCLKTWLNWSKGHAGINGWFVWWAANGLGIILVASLIVDWAASQSVLPSILTRDCGNGIAYKDAGVNLYGIQNSRFDQLGTVSTASGSFE